MSKYSDKQVRKSLGAPAYWSHWLIQACPDENCPQRQQSQSPVRDKFGEDCNLFERLREWRAAEQPLCGCGKREIVTYRHAKADHPEVEQFWREQELAEV